MKENTEIKLRKLRLLNFKGIRLKEIDFNAGITSILAANGKGKTTIADAFNWLLFGKDTKGRQSSGKSSFGLKTYDDSSTVIPRIPHEVAAELEVGGRIINLRRSFNEKWTKTRGEAEEHFSGNEEKRYMNDVPYSESEWKNKIADICPEETFRLITNPSYFSSLKYDEKRKKLISMAGGVSDKDIADGNEDFIALLAKLKNEDKTIDEYRKEIKAKKTLINSEVKGIPKRIEDQLAGMPEDADWDEISKSISDKEAQITEIEDNIMNAAKMEESENSRILDITERLHEVRAGIQKRGHEITDKASDSYRKLKGDHDALVDERNTLMKSVTNLQGDIKSSEEKIAGLKATREKLLSQYESLRKKSREIKAEQLTFSESDFKCPTCGHTFDADRIESIQAEMLENFENRKKARLEAVTSEINENISNGKSNASATKALAAQIEEYKTRITEKEARIAEIENNPSFSATLTPPDATPLIDADEKIRELREEEERLVAASTPRKSDADQSRKEMSERRDALRQEVKQLQQILFRRDEINRRKKFIEKLRTQLQQMSQEFTSLEKIEFIINAFTKARINAVEDKINSMFKTVRFKMFEIQINGGENEICEATLNGVPYGDCSNAERINMGLDIINAISRYEGVTAPIFIDNAEGVCNLLPTGAQVIRLVVSPEHDELTVK